MLLTETRSMISLHWSGMCELYYRTGRRFNLGLPILSDCVAEPAGLTGINRMHRMNRIGRMEPNGCIATIRPMLSIPLILLILVCLFPGRMV